MAIEPLPSRHDDVDRRPPLPVAGDVDRLLANLGAPPAPVLSVLDERWIDIVGPVVADHARPGGLVEGRLRIEVESSAWASQLRWSTDDVIRRCDAVLAPGAVTAVELRVTGRAPRRS